MTAISSTVVLCKSVLIIALYYMYFEIPFHSMKQEDEHAFIIRPVRREVNPVLLQERPHRHLYHEILWIRSGTGQHAIDDELIHITPNTFYWIKQGQIHDFQEGKNLNGYLIRFTSAFLPYDPHTSISTSLISQFKNRTSLKLDREEVPAYERILTSLHEEYESDTPNYKRQGILQHLLMVLLIMLERKSHELSISDIEVPDHPDKIVFRKFLHLLEDKFREEHQIGYYASELGVSNRKLSAISKQYAGLTAKQLILECLIREARRLLAFTQSTLAEITYQLGYEDAAYFCRIFKKQTGSTPQQYKRDLKLVS